MKKLIMKYFSLVVICLLVFLLNGCSSEGNDKITDYFPITSDTLYTFTGNMSEHTDYVVFNQYIDGNKFQRRFLTATTAMIEVMQYEKGELRLIYGEVQMYNHKSFLNEQSNSDILILKEPIKLNESWVQYESVYGNIVAEITALDKEITVAYGTFKTMEVTITNPDGTTEVEYYAKGLGRIKYDTIIKRSTEDLDGNVLDSSQEDLIIELSDVTENTTLSTACAVFYPDPDKTGQLLYDAAAIDFETNSNPDEILMKALKETLNNKGGIILSDSSKIVNVTNDFVNETVVAEVNSSFINDIKNAPAGEKAAFEAMINTFCYYYYGSRLKITSDGQEYKPEGITFDEEGFAGIIALENQEGDKDDKPNE